MKQNTVPPRFEMVIHLAHLIISYCPIILLSTIGMRESEKIAIMVTSTITVDEPP
jgi:hypothetical protein